MKRWFRFSDAQRGLKRVRDHFANAQWEAFGLHRLPKVRKLVTSEVEPGLRNTSMAPD